MTLPKRVSPLSVVLLVLMLAACQPSEQTAADVIFHNGAIYTVDEDRSWAEAVAVKDGRFMAVGGSDEVLALSGPDTELHDLQGNMAIPGIQDSHFHTDADIYMDCSTAGFTPDRMREVLNDCKDRQVAGHPWLVVTGLELWEADSIDNSAVNEVFPSFPVLVRDQSYHTVVVNAAGLAVAGIDADTPDPEGGRILRDPETGELMGVLAEDAAIDLVTSVIPPYGEDATRAAFMQLFDQVLSMGITSLQSAYVSKPALEMMGDLDHSGVPMPYMLAHLAWRSGDAELEQLIRDRADYASPHIRTDAVKVFIDGVPIPPAFTHVPVDENNEVDERNLLVPREVLNQKLIEWDAAGIKVKMHAAGDGSVRVALDAIEAAREANGFSGIFHEPGHTTEISPQDIPRFAALQATAELSPYLWHAGPMAELLGYHFKPLHDNSALITLGSDFPVVPSFNPFPPLQGVVERGEKALPIADALELVTRNAAISVNRLDEMGSIEVGKIANLVVLDRNLLEVPSSQIGGTQVLMTVLDGQVVHRQ